MTPDVSRRRVLASLGVAGSFATGFGWRAFATRTPPYTRYTYAQSDGETDGLRLRVAWYETYNGAFRSAHGGSTEGNATRVLDPGTAPAYVEEATGPVVAIGDVLPGDSGSVAVGLLADSIPETEDGADVWVRAELGDELENGVTEPELRAGGEDDPGDGTSPGELAARVRSRCWLDAGIVAGAGACDGRYLAGEPVLHSGSLGETVAALANGVRIAACLREGARVCLGLEWTLPVDEGNAVQTDAVAFDLTFIAQSCGGGNPFATGGEST